MLEDQSWGWMSCWAGRQVKEIIFFLSFSFYHNIYFGFPPLYLKLAFISFCFWYCSFLSSCSHFIYSFIPKFAPPRHGALTGQKIAYIYPDFQTALTGVFVDGVMKEAQEVSESINS